jgi:hypothetical protein
VGQKGTGKLSGDQEESMRTVVALGTVALLTVAIIVGWATRTASYTDHAKTVAARTTPIVPFELMKKSNGLQHQQYDAY